MNPIQPPKATGIRRLWNALLYSFAGLRAAAVSEAAFRQELLLAAVLIPAAFIVTIEPVERALLIGSTLLVLVVELLNSALEAVVDRVSLERHILAKRAKDMGSAAVFLSLANLVTIWVLVLLSD